MTDPLDSLIVDGQAAVRQKVATALSGRVGLEPDRDAVHLLVDGGSTRSRVVLALLGQVALSLLKPGASGRMRPQEIADLTGIKPGTVRPVLMKLANERIVAADEEGAYTVPVPQLDRAIAIGVAKEDAA